MAQVVDANVREAGRQLQALLLRPGQALVVGGLAVEPTFEPMDKVGGRTALCAGPKPYRRALAKASPRRLQVGPPGAGVPAADDPRVVGLALKIGEHFESWGAKVDDPGAGLGVREPQGPSFEVHIVPTSAS
jgi:hypothetical protein